LGMRQGDNKETKKKTKKKTAKKKSVDQRGVREGPKKRVHEWGGE